MPIKIPNNLPAEKLLNAENIFFMNAERAAHQDIRELQILILNLMPIKQTTEAQLIRMLSNSPLQTEISLLHPKSHISKNTSEDHLVNFYNTFEEIKHRKFDGLIITGAPVENLEFEDVTYWKEFTEILEWSKHNCTSVFHICWAAQAGLYYHYGIKKHQVDEKVFGVYQHILTKKHTNLTKGFDEIFMAPHSRHTDLDRQAIIDHPDIDIIAESEEAGVYLVMSKDGKYIFVTGHSEYDANTLSDEYFRDKNKGLPIQVPVNYFPNNDSTQQPIVNWRAHGNLLYTNWLNYYIYQVTPFDLKEVGENNA